MTPFLQAVAQDLYRRFGNNLSRTAIIFPGKRACLWMNRYLSQSAGQPIWSPAYFTISELFDTLTPLKVENPIRLVCLLHKIYQSHIQNNESLDDFYNWGELMLADFDDIDKNLVDTESLFVNLADTKEIDSHFDFLTDEQRQLLSRFFVTFGKDDTPLKQRFALLWKVMGTIYNELRNTLEAQGIAYEGMRQRHTIEHLASTELIYDHYIIVGFNVLNRVEQTLFDHLHASGRALFYWDYDQYYVNNPLHEAGTFIRENLERYGNALTDSPIYDNLNHLTNITTISTPTDNAQARYIHQWLTTYHDKQHEQDTAIVLCNEDIALPVLHALPNDKVSNVNVTMGFKLTQTSIYHLINTYLHLHTRGYDSNKRHYSFDTVQQFLSHPYIIHLHDEATEFVISLAQTNRLYINDTELSGHPTIGYLFVHPTDNVTLLNSISNLVTRLRVLFIDDSVSAPYSQLNQEALFRIHQTTQSLQALTLDGTLDLRPTTLVRLFQRIMKSTTVPFHGEPAIGLQVMGLLETRNLDFSNLIILSANEGKLPQATNEATYIPYNIREAFGMNTQQRQNAVYAYYFYRLIQRAKHVTVLYNDGTDGMNRQEPTRYLMQLQVEHPSDISQYTLSETTQPQAYEPVSIPQTNYTRRKLQEHFSYKPKGKKTYRLSPSALNDYLDCRLRFYLKHIEGINPPEAINTDIDVAHFGTIFHKSAELAYDYLTQQGNTIHAYELEALMNNKSRIEQIVDEAFRQEFFHTESSEALPYNGTQLIVRHAISNYLHQLLRIDTHRAPFQYIESEKQVHYPLTINSHGETLTLLLGGTVDRVDCKQGITRIIDYKTGGKQKSIKSVSDLFDRTKARDNYVFQAFYYAHLLLQEYGQIAPSLLFVRKIADENFEPGITINGQAVTDYRVYSEEFASLLNHTIDEIFNSDEPYTPAAYKDACKYCKFITLCRRKRDN